MRRRVAAQLALVARRRDHLAVANDHGADRHVVVLERALGLAQRQSHEVLVAREDTGLTFTAPPAAGPRRRSASPQPAQRAGRPATRTPSRGERQRRRPAAAEAPVVDQLAVPVDRVGERPVEGAGPVAELTASLARRVAPVLGHQHETLRRDRRRAARAAPRRAPRARSPRGRTSSGWRTPESSATRSNSSTQLASCPPKHVALARACRARRRAGGPSRRREHRRRCLPVDDRRQAPAQVVADHARTRCRPGWCGRPATPNT